MKLCVIVAIAAVIAGVSAVQLDDPVSMEQWIEAVGPENAKFAEPGQGIGETLQYSRSGALSYAKAHWNHPNHKCSTAYSKCSPYSYWGSEVCGYPSHGGDCADFVSQCLLAGSHAKLNQGHPCRGYPCGKEEIGAKNLGDCLSHVHGWKRTCGKHHAPPSSLKAGDVLIYHKDGCSSFHAHATMVVHRGHGDDVTIACHSNAHYNIHYTYMTKSFPYLEWLEYTGRAEDTVDAETFHRLRGGAQPIEQ